MLSRWPWFTGHNGPSKLEWTVAIHTLGTGMFISAPWSNFTASRALMTAGDMMPEWLWAAIFSASGTAMILALHVDHRVRWTAYARAAAMLVAMATYCALGWAFLHATPSSIGAFNTFSLALLFCGTGFIAACRDIGHDIASRRERHDGD